MKVSPTVLEDFIENSGLSFHKTPASWIFDCPNCGKKKKLYIRRKDGRYVCFSGSCTRDNFSGKSPEYALEVLTKTPLKTLRSLLYEEAAEVGKLALAAPVFYDEDDDEIVVVEESTPTVLTYPYHYYKLNHPHAAKGIAYLASRGIPLAIAQEYGIRYSPIEQRVIFPVRSEEGLLGWQGRLITPTDWLDEESGAMASASKILSSPQLPKETTVMFGHRLTTDHVVLCEGPVDAIKAHLCGGNVASMGKGVSAGQIEFIKHVIEIFVGQSGRSCRSTRRFYSGLDPDAADEVGRLVEAFGDDYECYQLEPPLDKDLGAMTFEEVYDLYRRARRIDTTSLFVFVGA